ncbi:hypothetical protein B0T14DRAFT_268365 [Immersiella caudata]|uniref:Uncharacterized protein n=1 Tax=Immersiella caudata TaxID=314043 RepID=A0AA39WL37_9PEZI|nr:hypothetical protein B0T14DRAFT_268365 [Immersiella caudata]
MSRPNQLNPASADGRYQFCHHSLVEPTIYLESLKIEGTSLGVRQTQEPYPVRAFCANNNTGQNQVTPEALESLLEPDISTHQLSQWAENEKLNVTIGWRLKPTGILAETLHTVSSGQNLAGSYGVKFAGNIDWVIRGSRHLEDFTRATEARIGSLAPVPYSLAMSHPVSKVSITMLPPATESQRRGERRDWRSPSQYGSPLPASGVLTPATIARATRHQPRQQDARLAQTARLAEAYKSHAEDVYRSTGDTTEVGRALELSGKLLAAQLQ